MRTHTHSGQVAPSLCSKNVAWLSHPATFRNAGYAVEPNHIQCGILSETLCGEGENKFRETIQNDMVAKHWPFGNAKQAVWQCKTGHTALRNSPFGTIDGVVPASLCGSAGCATRPIRKQHLQKHPPSPWHGGCGAAPIQLLLRQE